LASYRLLSIKPFYLIAPKILGIDKIQCHELLRLIKENNYDLVLYPSSAYEVQIFDTIESSSVGGAKSFFIIDNWDNLSSKTSFWKKPDFIGTWGRQSSNHAIEIQGFLEEQIFELGSARFSNYHAKSNNSNFELLLPKNYALFLGSFLYFDEISALGQINTEILDNPNIYGDLEVLYRPHPYSENAERFQNCNFSRIILDPQIENSIFSSHENEGRTLNRLSLDYYPNLISKSKFIVGGLTTMLLECSLFDKNYLALVYREKDNLVTSPHLSYRGYTHFEGIENLPNLSFCSDSSLIGFSFRRVFEAKNQTYDKKSLNYFVHTDVGNYSLKLSKAIDVILESIK
jgi:hypothetical protein